MGEGCEKASTLLYYSEGVHKNGEMKMRKGYWCGTHKTVHPEKDWVRIKPVGGA